MTDSDNLRLCTNCGDYDTTNDNGICWHCREQEMIDDAVPDAPPYDWDEGYEPLCAYCRRSGVDLLHLSEDVWICPSCNYEYYADDEDDL